ncbi:MAG TPA: hypothetical protein VET89_12510 [Stellaceae bacterium]|nr:hypothetical protein [Stellaceae bacterium]
MRTETMLTALCRAGVALALLVLVAAAALAASDDLKAIETAGTGTLTMCRNWIAFRSCRDYQNIALPAHIAIGDTVELEFGSNPKQYDFPVVRILRSDTKCTVLSHAGDSTENVEKIEVASCRASAAPN